MILPDAHPEGLTLYLDRDFALNYGVAMDLTGCTLYSDIVNENGVKVASFTMAVLTSSPTPGPLGYSTFSRVLLSEDMETAGLVPNLRYKTDIAVVGYSGAGLADSLTTVGYLTVKPTATVPPL